MTRNMRGVIDMADMKRKHPECRLTRREFQRQGYAWAAGLAMAGAWSGRAWAAEEKAWRMRLSCSTINFMSLPVEKAIERIASLGFEAVDIWSAHAGCPHLDDVLDRLGPQGLSDLLARHKLKLYAFSVYQGGYAKYAELLGKCGGGVAIHGSTKQDDAASIADQMKAYLEGLKPELELAERHNSYVAVENHGNALLNSLDSLRAFVELNEHPRLGIALAPYHLQRQGVSIEEAIRVCGKQLLFFYAWQNAPDTQQLPGLGPADCKPWIQALAEINYKWYVNPFMHHEPEPDAMVKAMAESMSYLQKCYLELNAS